MRQKLLELHYFKVWVLCWKSLCPPNIGVRGPLGRSWKRMFLDLAPRVVIFVHRDRLQSKERATAVTIWYFSSFYASYFFRKLGKLWFLWWRLLQWRHYLVSWLEKSSFSRFSEKIWNVETQKISYRNRSRTLFRLRSVSMHENHYFGR